MTKEEYDKQIALYDMCNAKVNGDNVANPNTGDRCILITIKNPIKECINVSPRFKQIDECQ